MSSGRPVQTPDTPSHPLLARWLRGTTCFRLWIPRSVLFENTDYIILKHNSHADYCGRFYDNVACRAYAALYRKADVTEGASGASAFELGDGALRRWEGRISRKQVRADCAALGIEFNSPLPAE